ncbi:hypothetical protein OAN96_00250 [Candidatus Gracilibacteria bacterium]|nr:hypothetical protein [Candidatus Gracilibacteria bacterium]
MYAKKESVGTDKRVVNNVESKGLQDYIGSGIESIGDFLLSKNEDEGEEDPSWIESSSQALLGQADDILDVASDYSLRQIEVCLNELGDQKDKILNSLAKNGSSILESLLIKVEDKIEALTSKLLRL